MEAILFLFFLPLMSCLHLMRRPEERELEARERAEERLYLASWGVMFSAQTAAASISLPPARDR